ncbi:MAG: radical SAM protein [Deltaproteobacteria bacterium]|nr:radical SAM protein [Deltaproteobacteria bacterium]
MLTYKNGPASDPFYDIYSSDAWLRDFDPPGAFPLFLNVEPTNVCQLDCLFCSRQLSQRPFGSLGLDLAEAMAEEAASYPGTAVRFTGWGEPLLHPKIADLAAVFKKRGVRLKIYTNGLALTPKLMDRLIELEVDDLQFSLQGLNEAQYLKNRVGSDWGRLKANAAMAFERRGKAKKPFLSVLTSALAAELAEAKAEDFTSEWLGVADKVAVDLTNLNFVSELDRVRPLLGEQSKSLRRGRCVDVFLALEVKYDGSIQFCGQDSKGLSEHTIGKLGEMTLAEAWAGPEMERKRDQVGRNLGHDQSPVCKNCYHNTDKYDLFKKGPPAPESAGLS